MQYNSHIYVKWTQEIEKVLEQRATKQSKQPNKKKSKNSLPLLLGSSANKNQKTVTKPVAENSALLD